MFNLFKKKDKCPNCGEKMTHMYGRLRCTSCSYCVTDTHNVTINGQLIECDNKSPIEPQPQPQPQVRPQVQQTYNRPVSGTTGSTVPQSYLPKNDVPQGAPGSAFRNNKRPKTPGQKIARIFVIYFVICFLVMAAMFAITAINSRENTDNFFDFDILNPIDDTEYDDDGSLGVSQLEGGSQLSDAFRELYFDITRDNKANITDVVMLKVDTDNGFFEYSFDDGIRHTVYMDKDSSINREDIQYFYNIEELYLGDYAFSTHSYSTPVFVFPNLKVLECGMGLNEISQVFHHTDVFEELYLDCDSLFATLEGAKLFTNLKVLKFNAYYIDDLSEVTAIPNLEHLYITRATNFKDYTSIAQLKNLKSLSIEDADYLKTLEIIKNMSNLEYLKITDSQIEDISILANFKDTLKHLILTDNYSIDDISVLKNMKSLETLGIKCPYDVEMPSLTHMTNLSTVYLQNPDDLSIISGMESIKYLTIKSGHVHNYDEVGTLKNLEYFEADDSNASIMNIDGLFKLKNIKTLIFDYIYYSGNIEGLMNIKTLQYFSFTNGKCEINLENVKKNDNLQTIILDNTLFFDYPQPNANGYVDTYNAPAINITEDLKYFAEYTNLKALSLRGMKIENLEFVRDLKMLECIDISSNMITSLEPLEDLRKLKTVYCEGNTIIDLGNLGSDVNVYK